MMNFQRSIKTSKSGPERQHVYSTAAGSLPTIQAPVRSLLQLQRCAGNQVVSKLMQSDALSNRIAVNRAGDKYEREADRLANTMTAKQTFGQPAVTNTGDCSPVGNITPLVQNQSDGGVPSNAAALQNSLEGYSGAGLPLPKAPRRLMESRFGSDFSDVRVHASSQAAEMCRNINAHAFTMGRDMYFGAGQFQPETIVGQKLLLHELAHTIQQHSFRNHPFGGGQARSSDHAPVIQRQERTAEGSQGTEEITAQTIFPYPHGSRVRLNRILSDALFGTLSSMRPRLAAGLNAVINETGTVTTVSDDLFELTFSASANLPAAGGAPAVRLNNITLRLQRRSTGTFDIELSGQTDPQASPTIIEAQRDLTARRGSGGIILSADGGETLVAPGADVDQIRLSALRPLSMDLIQLTRLTGARPGSAAERAVGERLDSQARSQTRFRRQRLYAGIGFQSAAELSPLFAASWQISFLPIPQAGSFFQIPLEVQLQYAPSASVLAALSSGAELSLSGVAPVNLRLVAGWAAGSIQGQTPPGATERPVHGAFGPVLGVGGGLELGRFRLDLRYEHLFNLIEDSPNADALLLRLGGTF